MKASQSSVGRELENFFQWVIPVCERIPKNSIPLQEAGRTLVHAIIDTQAYVRLALKTSDESARLQLIDAMILNMETIKSIMDALVEYSTSPSHAHVLSRAQKGSYLTQMESICRQLGGWERKTRRVVEGQKAGATGGQRGFARQNCG